MGQWEEAASGPCSGPYARREDVVQQDRARQQQQQCVRVFALGMPVGGGHIFFDAGWEDQYRMPTGYMAGSPYTFEYLQGSRRSRRGCVGPEYGSSFWASR